MAKALPSKSSAKQTASISFRQIPLPGPAAGRFSKSPILGKGENRQLPQTGPSALSAVTNLLFLMELLSPESVGTNSTSLSATELEAEISKCVLDKAKQLPPSNENIARVLNLFDIIKELPKKNPVIRPAPNSATEFVDTPFCEMFSILGIPFIHGRFNEQEIPMFEKHIDEGQPGILYSTGEFHTIFKCHNTIYKLVVDEAIVQEYPNAVWESITMGNKGQLLDLNFVVVSADIKMKLHMCTRFRCSKEFYSRQNLERHYEYHKTSFEAEQLPPQKESIGHFWDNLPLEDGMSILSVGYAAVEQFHGCSIKSMLNKWVTSEELITAPDGLKHALRLTMNFAGVINLKPSSKDLFDILNVGSEDGFLSTNFYKKRLILKEREVNENAKVNDNAIWSMIACFSLAVEDELVMDFL